MALLLLACAVPLSLPVGTLAFRSGAALASADGVTIHIKGKGGHAAMPHYACDPIVAGSSIVMALQSIVARNVDPLQSAVVTVGVFQAGVANNVIPPSARLELSVRALNREVRALLRQRIHEIVAAQAQSLGVSAELDYQDENGIRIPEVLVPYTGFARI